MNWRIAVPVVVLLGAVGYVIYHAVTSPAYEAQKKPSVVLQRFADTLLKHRDVEKAARPCSRRAAQACRRLLAELAAREKADPNFRLDHFRLQLPSGETGTQVSTISLIDGRRNIFLIIDCTLQQMPDNSWKITKLTWRPLVEP